MNKSKNIDKIILKTGIRHFFIEQSLLDLKNA